MNQEQRFITGKQFKDMLLGAYHSFEKNYESINDLNVFPVPDGDTGTNMMHTLASVAKEVSKMPDTCDAGEVGTVAGRAAIMGARGNSGVILSQLLRGIGKGTAGKKVLTHTEFGKAFQYGVLYAYRSVSTPVEGTILTVARGMAKGTYNKIRGENTFVEILQAAIENGKEYLKRTPDMLPALKAAGVVDAGGQGLIVFFEGCVAGIQGKDCEVLPIEKSTKPMNRAQNIEPLDLEFPYCTEFIVKGANVTKQTVADALIATNGADFAIMKEPFKFDLPFDIALSKSYDETTLNVDVDDFRYFHPRINEILTKYENDCVHSVLQNKGSCPRD